MMRHSTLFAACTLASTLSAVARAQQGGGAGRDGAVDRRSGPMPPHIGANNGLAADAAADVST